MFSLPAWWAGVKNALMNFPCKNLPLLIISTSTNDAFPDDSSCSHESNKKEANMTSEKVRKLLPDRLANGVFFSPVKLRSIWKKKGSLSSQRSWGLTPTPRGLAWNNLWCCLCQCWLLFGGKTNGLNSRPGFLAHRKPACYGKGFAETRKLTDGCCNPG